MKEMRVEESEKENKKRKRRTLDAQCGSLEAIIVRKDRPTIVSGKGTFI